MTEEYFAVPQKLPRVDSESGKGRPYLRTFKSKQDAENPPKRVSKAAGLFKKKAPVSDDDETDVESTSKPSAPSGEAPEASQKAKEPKAPVPVTEVAPEVKVPPSAPVLAAAAQTAPVSSSSSSQAPPSSGEPLKLLLQVSFIYRYQFSVRPRDRGTL